MNQTKLAPWLLGLLVCACASPRSQLDRMYQQFERDAAQADRGEADAQLMERTAQRMRIVREMFEARSLTTAADYFKASVMLVDRADELGDLALAYDLALKSAELGEERGFRVAAEAIDKQMLKQGLQQRYGTQYVYEPVIRAWRLYPVDPRTTDVERAAMGVPPMDELLKSQELLNRAEHAQRVRPVN